MVLTRLAVAVVVLAGCERAPPLARLEPFAGEWRCPMEHRTAGEGAGRVMQDVTIALEPGGSRYAVRFAPDPSEPSPDAVTSIAYWSYDGAAKQFVSEASLGDGQTAAREQYSSPGPQDGELVWTGEVHSAITARVRMAWKRTGSGLELLVEAFGDQRWRPLSTATCTRATAARARPAPPSPPPQPARAPVEPSAPRSVFVHDRSDHFGYKAIDATDEERALANAAAERAQAEIDQAVELSHGTIDKAEAITRIQKAYEQRDRELVAIFGEDRAGVLRELHVIDGVEVPDDTDPDDPDQP